MKFRDMSEYDYDFALVRFINPNYPEEQQTALVGAAIEIGGKWKEPYKAVEYLTNTGEPLVPVGFVNLDDLEQHLLG